MHAFEGHFPRAGCLSCALNNTCSIVWFLTDHASQVIFENALEDASAGREAAALAVEEAARDRVGVRLPMQCHASIT